MKKTLIILIVAILSGVTMNAQNLKLDEILKKHFDAIGQDKLVKVNTLKMTGTMAVMGMELSMSMYRKRPAKMRMEIEVQGTKMIQTYNGTDGYMINPMTGSTEAQKVSDDQLAQFKNQADIDGEFFNFQEKGSTLELIGTEDINGIQAYKIKLVDKSAKTSYHFFDCSNFTLIKTISTQQNMQGVDAEMETFFTYTQVEGISMPSSIEVKEGSNTVYKMTFDELKINEELTDDLFEKPTI